MSKHQYLRPKASWKINELESRMMLAGDVGDAIATSTAAEVPAEIAVADHASNHRQSASKLLFVDPSVEDFSELTNSVADDVEIVLLNSEQGGIDQVSRVLAGRKDVQSVHVLAHGSAGQVQLGNEIVDEARLVQAQDQIRQWRGSLSDSADILLYSCETGNGAVGQQFMGRLAVLTGADVAASTNTTGSAASKADWDLEVEVGNVDSAIVFSRAARSEYSGTLAISIRAAGVTGEEQMRLVVDGNVVETWTVGGDAYASEFETYSVELEGVDANDVRIEFTNDQYDEANGIDRNLRVDSVTIDGVIYETEDPSVFSTGSWVPGEGVTPGFDQTEFLHANGYFQFADNGQGNGTQIRIAANGQEGGERMELRIAGEIVQAWEVGTEQGIYTYHADSTVDIADVQVHFTNDEYDPDSGVDRNLTVDFVQLDDTRYETESPTTFSTGSWLPEDGIQPGFRHSETLNTNGFFQYGAGENNGTQIQISARGEEGGESMSLVIAGETVQTWEVGTDQAVFVYQANTDIDINDVQIHFTNDQYDPDNGVDRNLYVDYVQLGESRYETESPTTFSTGTWKAEDGIQPGFRQSEALHVNGYFQFSGETQNPSVLTVSDASGQQGSVIGLEISVVVPEGSQASVLLSNVPSGAVVLSHGNALEAFEDRVLVPVSDLNGLTITPPSDFAGSILLNVEAIILDSEFNETIESATLTVAVLPNDGNYSRNGSEDRDFIIAYHGNTVIDSLGGNDVLVGLDADDQLKGGDGNDVVIGGVGADTLIGDAGDDVLDGGLGTDNLQGGQGNDRIFGDGGDDILDGGSGDDELVGGLGNDVIRGGAGFDTVVLEGTRDQYVIQSSGDGVSFIGPGGTDTVFDVELVRFADVTVPFESVTDPNFVGTPLPAQDGATAGDDSLSGSVVNGLGGDDSISGTDGDDILLGGTGDDQIDGLAGDDFLQGDEGNDIINGGDGNDFISVTGGVDTIDGGSGWDLVDFSQASNAVTVDLSTGRTEGGNGRTQLTSVESAFGSRDGDTFRFEELKPGDYYSIDSADGFDVLDLRQFRADQVSVQGHYVQVFFDGGGVAEIDAYNVEFVQLLDAAIQTSDGQIVRFEENDFVEGDDGDNSLFGKSGDDRVLGRGGNDYLSGGDGDDVLIGGDGNDELDGGNGRDILLGDAGDDVLNGNQGDDRIVDETGNNTVDGGNGVDTLALEGDRQDYTAELLDDGRIRITGASGTTTAKNVELFDFNGNVVDIPELLNNNPVAQPDSFSGPANTPIGGSVAGNDFDPDGDTLIFQLARPPQNGTVQFSPTGAFLYTPNPGFVGTDTFLYVATDVNGGLAVVPVTIVITG